MKKSSSRSDNNINSSGGYDEAEMRDWLISELMRQSDAVVSPGRCNSADYLDTLDRCQLGRIKRIVYGNGGKIVSVELVPLVEINKALAEIAGITRRNGDGGARKTRALIIRTQSPE